MQGCIGIAVLVLVIAATSPGCAEEASEAEIERMCERLLVLRDKSGDEKMKAGCVAEAKEKGVSRRQAMCRIMAVNTQEYWNRCRTGEARP